MVSLVARSGLSEIRHTGTPGLGIFWVTCAGLSVCVFGVTATGPVLCDGCKCHVLHR